MVPMAKGLSCNSSTASLPHTHSVLKYRLTTYFPLCINQSLFLLCRIDGQAERWETRYCFWSNTPLGCLSLPISLTWFLSRKLAEVQLEPGDGWDDRLAAPSIHLGKSQRGGKAAVDFPFAQVRRCPSSCPLWLQQLDPMGVPAWACWQHTPTGSAAGTQWLAWFLRCTHLCHRRGSSSSKPHSAIRPDPLYACVRGLDHTRTVTEFLCVPGTRVP